MRKMETLLLLSPELSVEERETILKTMDEVVAREGGKMLLVDQWGMRDLAYPVRKQMRGFYVRLEYAAPSQLVAELERIIRITEKCGFEPLHDFEHLRRCADKVINQGVKMGEGWLIPAEMAALAETGTDNIVCAQPFGCLPNHIAGKGTIRTLKQMYEHENIVAVDYDPSATKVNQENRIKLMLATARENFSRAKGGGKEPSDAEQK